MLIRSHLCVSGGLTEKEKRFTEQQIYRFRSAVDSLHASGIICIRELPAGESAGYGLAYTAQSKRKIAIVSAGSAARNQSCVHRQIRGQRNTGGGYGG